MTGRSDMRIGIVGCAGRMGGMLARQVAATDGVALAAGVEASGHPAVGRDLGEVAGLGHLGIPVGDDAVRLFAEVDAVLEFTTPDATAEHAALAAQARTVHVIGTTGLDAEQQAALRRAAAHTPVVWAPNMSLGVNLLLALVEEAAKALGEEYDIEIFEMHHRAKVDAPSGTALALGEAAARGRNVSLEEVARRVRDGHTGPRARGEIGFAVLRGGDVAGEHVVTFAGDGERLELAHRASSRAVFAQGAVQAALWARDKPAGLYGMRDVLGF